MKIVVIGTGHLGLVSGVRLDDVGSNVHAKQLRCSILKLKLSG